MGSLAALSAQAAATSLASDDPTWAHWVVDVYGRICAVPPIQVVERVGEVAVKHGLLFSGAIDQLLTRLEVAQSQGVGPDAAPRGPFTPEEVEALERLRQFRANLSGLPGGPGAVPKAVRHIPTA
jgi:hypothetical protein